TIHSLPIVHWPGRLSVQQQWPNTTPVYTPTPTTADPPPANNTTPEMYISLRATPGLGMWCPSASFSSTAPQTTRHSPVMRTTSRSDSPPLFRISIRLRLRTQFMSCTAELRSCLRRTARAKRHRAMPAPMRQSLEKLVVVERRSMPPRPQPRMNLAGSRNHHSSTCSSSMLRWIWSGSGPAGWSSRIGGKSSSSDQHPVAMCSNPGLVLRVVSKATSCLFPRG
uniref:Uncharacterized protein n=1 Tax=Oncorhynchus tshawytscha TaxID=74940 RepID=A0A8C8F0M5_ONCTS